MLEKLKLDGEKYWYGSGWRQTRGLVSAHGKREAPQLLDDMAQPDANISREITRYIERVARSILRRSGGRPDAKAQYAVSLIADVSILVSLVERDKVMAGDKGHVDRATAFSVIFKTFVNRSRLRLGGTTQNRLENWEAIERISRDIIAETKSLGPIDRLSTEHIKAVHNRLATRSNKNLTVGIDALRGYFQEFCEEAFHQYDDDEPAASLQQYLQITKDLDMEIAVGQCVKRLSEKNGQADVDAVLVNFGCHPTVNVPFSRYSSVLGITQYELKKRFDRGTQFLKRCIGMSIDFATER